MAEGLWHTARHFRRQSADCRSLGSPLYAGLLDHIASDLETGGPSADLLVDHLVERGAGLLPLRLLGAVHAEVLSRQAPGLAMYYPSVGGEADPGENADQAWPALRDVLATHGGSLRPWLDRAPQTNEVGRGVALVGALCHLVATADLPLRLIEIGASAGLNLRADRFHITGAGASYGDPASPVQLLEGWQGSPPPDVIPLVEHRSGGDLNPIDPTTPSGRLTLTAYVWADQLDRIERLRGGLALAAALPAELRTEPALATTQRIALSPGRWTVLWHSVFRQYLTDQEYDDLMAAIAVVASTATVDSRFAHVSVEPASRSGDGDVEVLLSTWPGGKQRQLGVAAPHGMPTTWSEEPDPPPDGVS